MLINEPHHYGDFADLASLTKQLESMTNAIGFDDLTGAEILMSPSLIVDLQGLTHILEMVIILQQRVPLWMRSYR